MRQHCNCHGVVVCALGFPFAHAQREQIRDGSVKELTAWRQRVRSKTWVRVRADLYHIQCMAIFLFSRVDHRGSSVRFSARVFETEQDPKTLDDRLDYV